MLKEDQIATSSTRSRIDINIALLSISFLLFTLIITINSSLLTVNILLAAELVLTIPLLVTSSFARTKLIGSNKKRLWNNFGYITFTIAYGLLINVIGMFLNSLVNLRISMVFFGVNILMALLYSAMEIAEDKTKLRSRLYKDAFFVLILVLGGVLPAMGVY